MVKRVHISRPVLAVMLAAAGLVAIAEALPMPWLAPVMRTVLPCMASPLDVGRYDAKSRPVVSRIFAQRFLIFGLVNGRVAVNRCLHSNPNFFRLR